MGTVIAICAAVIFVWALTKLFSVIENRRRLAEKRENEPSRKLHAIGESAFFREHGLRPFAQLRIRYGDAEGSQTEREIAVYHVDLRDGAIQAYCRLRKDRRSFYIKRVAEAIDIETGEVVADLKSFLREARSRSR